jgi:hypothetical protein
MACPAVVNYQADPGIKMLPRRLHPETAKNDGALPVLEVLAGILLFACTVALVPVLAMEIMEAAGALR